MSETSRHTPGPWMVEPESFEDSGPAIGSFYQEPTIVANDKTVATVRIGIAETEANARLIAAAPDYHVAAHGLAMLVLQAGLYHEDMDVRDAVDALLAIHAKAEGR